VDPAHTTTAEHIEALLDEHLSWMLSLERDGHVLASGPVIEGPGVGPGSGLTVLRADSAEHAERIAAGDPFVHAGLRDFTVLRWRVMEGALTVRLSLGTSRYTFQ